MITLLLPNLAAAVSRAIDPVPSVAGLQPSRVITNNIDSDYFTFPGDLPDTLRVLAIRVHFQPDTLSTTFGDGDFMYDFPDTVNQAGWLLDPPPHDRQFFQDHLLAARNYFDKYSYGKLTLAGVDSSGEGGDVYPLDSQASYELPYPIWHINYGNDDHQRLNEKLVQLFADAWTLADADPDVDVSKYDMFIVFHAGAGNEFDTGYDMTPFDIPSVFISENDLAEFGNLPNGIQLEEGVVPNGIILPETQRQPGVDVGMHGTVVAQIGFAIGLPHLYNTETGAAGIGMLGLMDRGFGGYFGTIPLPPSAWSRVFMGWDTPVEASAFSELDTVRVGGLHLPDDVFSTSLEDPDDVVRLLRIPITDTEYYLVEARLRDPDEDSLTYAVDRDNDTLWFHDNYSWEAQEGFGVAVEYEDYDFDMPASGVLVWHIDDRLIRNRYADDRIQNDFDMRGIRLEEADGTWDIGNEYPFLTAGDGTEYGYFADAFYRDNEFWRESNRPLFNPEFSTNTHPSSVTNDGGYTHLTFSRFSGIGDTMSFRISNSWVEEEFPVQLDWDHVFDISAGDFNGDGIDEIVVLGADDWPAQIAIIDSVGIQRYDLSEVNTRDNLGSHMAIDDMDLDGDDDLVITLNGAGGYADNGILIASFELGTNEFSTKSFIIDETYNYRSISVAKAADGTPYAIAQCLKIPEEDLRIVALKYDDPVDEPSIDTTFATGGLFVRSGFTIIPEDPVDGHDAIIWMTNMDVLQLNLSAGTVNLIDTQDIDVELEFQEWNLHDVIASDFDGDRSPEYVGMNFDGGVDDNGYMILLQFTESGPDSWPTPHVTTIPLDWSPYELRVLDLDNDGIPEPACLTGNSNEYDIFGIELNGIVSEGSPLTLSSKGGSPLPYNSLVIDSDGDGNLEWFSSTTGMSDSWPPVSIAAYDVSDGRVLPGFPLSILTDQETNRTRMFVTDLDSDDNLEFVATSGMPWGLRITAYNLPGFSGEKQVLWSEEGGNPANTRYVSYDPGETATRAPFTMDDAYCWPNPVMQEDVAHFRYPAKDGNAEVVIYDIAGREHLTQSGSSSGGLEVEQAEIEVDVSALPSGVYVARLEVGGEVKLIRFAVVN